MISIKEARKRVRYSEGDMATLLGISYSAYRNKESGRSDFTIAEALNFAKIVDVPITDINFFHNKGVQM